MSQLIIQPSNADNYLGQASPDNNYGTSVNLYVTSGKNSFRRPILRFDFTSLPDGVTITAATINLYYYGYLTDPVGRTYWADRITQTAWTETGSTWNKYDGTNNWATPGGDCTPTYYGSIVVPASYGWISWNLLSMVQYCQSSAGKKLDVRILDANEGSGDCTAIFHSNNYTTDTTLCPKLIITYTGAYTMAADGGTYAKTGATAGLPAARNIAASAASPYALTGQSVAFTAARQMAAAGTSYSLTGQAAALTAKRQMTAGPDSYALTGNTVDLKLARGIPANEGSYLLTGQDAALRAARLITALNGLYTLTGQNTNLIIGEHYEMMAEPGFYGEPYSRIVVTLDGRIYKKMGNIYLRLQ